MADSSAQNPETDADGMGPGQGQFVGNLALVLLVLAILIPAVILINAAMHGFS